MDARKPRKQHKKYKIRKDGRIVALRSFGNVVEGDVGGFIEHERNLSHDGNCWVHDDARVSGHAMLFGNAYVRHDAHVHGNAILYDNARVFGNARVHEDASLHNEVLVDDHAHVYGHAVLRHFVHVTDNAHVHGDVELRHALTLGHSADVYLTTHVIHVMHIVPWSVTVYRTMDGLRVQVGCQNFSAADMHNVAAKYNFRIADDSALLGIWNSIIAYAQTWHA